MRVTNYPLGTPEKLLGLLVANGKWKACKGREVMDAMEEDGHITGKKSLLVNKESCLMCDLKLQSIKNKKMHGCIVEYSEHSEDATYTELVMESELDF